MNNEVSFLIKAMRSLVGTLLTASLGISMTSNVVSSSFSLADYLFLTAFLGTNSSPHSTLSFASSNDLSGSEHEDDSSNA